MTRDDRSSFDQLQDDFTEEYGIGFDVKPHTNGKTVLIEVPGVLFGPRVFTVKCASEKDVHLLLHAIRAACVYASTEKARDT